jgi:hypothetical protein
MRALAAAERVGIPGVAICGLGFDRMAIAMGASFGMPSPHVVTYPGVIMADPMELTRSKARQFAPDVAHALLAAPDDAAPNAPVADTAAPAVLSVGTWTFDEVNERFIERGWSDGLPVAPPTASKIQAFLACTQRPADEVIGVLPPRNGECTVRTVAVNGIMAGCRPEYMPVLVAIAECLADSVFRLEDAGATPGWDPLVILAGPLVKALGFNSQHGAMRVGRQANTTVGRFVRMLMRNVAGFRIPPGVTDQAVFGSTFNVVMAEDPDAIAEIGWPSLQVEFGYEQTDTVVAVQSCRAITPPVYSAGDTSEMHAAPICEVISGICVSFAPEAVRAGLLDVTIGMGPAVAGAVARGGWSRADVGKYLQARALTTVSDLQTWGERNAGARDFASFAVRQAKRVGVEYDENKVPMIADASRTIIVVAGNPFRAQSRGYISNHTQGVRVSRRVDLS